MIASTDTSSSSESTSNFRLGHVMFERIIYNDRDWPSNKFIHNSKIAQKVFIRENIILLVIDDYSSN